MAIFLWQIQLVPTPTFAIFYIVKSALSGSQFSAFGGILAHLSRKVDYCKLLHAFLYKALFGRALEAMCMEVHKCGPEFFKRII